MPIDRVQTGNIVMQQKCFVNVVNTFTGRQFFLHSFLFVKSRFPFSVVVKKSTTPNAIFWSNSEEIRFHSKVCLVHHRRSQRSKCIQKRPAKKLKVEIEKKDLPQKAKVENEDFSRL